MSVISLFLTEVQLKVNFSPRAQLFCSLSVSVVQNLNTKILITTQVQIYMDYIPPWCWETSIPYLGPLATCDIDREYVAPLFHSPPFVLCIFCVFSPPGLEPGLFLGHWFVRAQLKARQTRKRQDTKARVGLEEEVFSLDCWNVRVGFWEDM